jgi:hypothetical protein
MTKESDKYLTNIYHDLQVALKLCEEAELRELNHIKERYALIFENLRSVSAKILKLNLKEENPQS